MVEPWGCVSPIVYFCLQTCTPGPVPNLRLTLESLMAVRGDCGCSYSINTVSCRASHSSQCLRPLSLLGYRGETSLSASELPFSSENSRGSGEEGGEACRTPTAQCTGDLDPFTRGVGQPP